MTDYLEHYGVKGMRWGVRRTPEQLGHRRLRSAKTSNMEKWGSDKDHNVAYVAGLSGSGKSTVAKSITDDKTDTIHLDTYYDKSLNEKQNRRFNAFLKKKGLKAPRDYDQQTRIKEKIYDKFEQAVDEFGREQFRKGRKVIAEGVQISNGTLWQDKEHYADKPMVILSTGKNASLYRAIMRESQKYDDVSFFDAMGSWSNYKQQVRNYTRSSQNLNELASTAHAKRGQKWVKDYLKRF